MKAIQRFLDLLEGRPWPPAASRRAFLLDQMRDWSGWLSGIGMTLQGHTGPRAPHWFHFVRRSDFQGAAGSLVEHPDCEVKGLPAEGNDIVLLCKHWMASTSLGQAPLVVLRAAALRSLPTRCPPMSTELRPLTPQCKRHIDKHVPILASVPYNLHQAAEHLHAWVHGSLENAPPVDVSACFLPEAVAIGGAAARPPHDAEVLAHDFEAQPGAVSLAREVQRRPAARFTGEYSDPRAAIVYGCAVALWEDQEMPLAEAISVGEQCWRRVAASFPGPRAPPAGPAGKAAAKAKAQAQRPQRAPAPAPCFAEDAEASDALEALDVERGV